MNSIPHSRVEISPAPEGLAAHHSEVFTPGCISFLAELVSNFQSSVAEVHLNTQGIFLKNTFF